MRRPSLLGGLRRKLFGRLMSRRHDAARSAARRLLCLKDWSKSSDREAVEKATEIILHAWRRATDGTPFEGVDPWECVKDVRFEDIGDGTSDCWMIFEIGDFEDSVNDRPFSGFPRGTVSMPESPVATPDPDRPGACNVQYTFAYTPCLHESIFTLVGLNAPDEIRCHRCGEAV